MTLVLLALRALLGTATPPEMVGDRLTAFISIKQFFALLDQFGGYSGLKQAGGGGVLAGQLVVGTLAGMLFGVVVERRHLPAALVAGAIVGLLWLLTIGLLWPNLATNYRGLPPDSAKLTTALGLLVAYATYGLVLLGAFDLLRARPSRTTPASLSTLPKVSTARRALLVGGAGAVVAVAVGSLVRRFVQQATFSYDGTEYRGPDVQPITPNERFYSVTKNIVDPDPSVNAWRLEIGGLVGPTTHLFI